MNTLKIQNLYVNINNKPILQGLSLNLRANETHILMGPNGSGKSTLARSIAGHPDCSIAGGKIIYQDKDITKFSPDRRARLGIFASWQNPIEITGVAMHSYLRQLPANEKKLKEQLNSLKIKKSFLARNLNEGFSGGEKKKSEILQMLILNPSLIILDEIDSGLDPESLKDILTLIQQRRAKNSILLLITHNPRILKFIKPDLAHIMKNGKIAISGGQEIVKEVEERGFSGFKF